jgi:hypothetical protein
VTVEITFGGLWTYAPGSSDEDERLPLAFLSDENTHVHGLLQIVVGKRVLPRLGYPPDGVCFNEWVRELSAASTTLQASDPASHVYDEGEEGQPAFHFERSGSEVFVSVRTSTISDGQGDSTWERVPCALEELVAAVSRFLLEFRQALVAQAGRDRARLWWRFARGPA